MKKQKITLKLKIDSATKNDKDEKIIFYVKKQAI